MSDARSPGSLQRRLSRWLALQTFLGLALVFWVVFLAIAHRIDVRQEAGLDEMQTLVEHLVDEVSTPPGIDEAAHLLGDIFLGHEEYSLSLDDGAGTAVVLPGAVDGHPGHASPRRGDGGSTEPTDRAETPDRYRERRFSLPGSALRGPLDARLVLDTYRDDDLLSRLALTLAGGVLIGTLVTSLAASWRVSTGLRPVTRLTARIDELDADTLERRLDGADQPTELRPLVEQFNGLLDRLARSYRQMAAFNADVAHELNTPIATLVTSNEMALRSGVSDADVADLLGSNLEELDRLGGIVRDMLFLSTAERGARARTTRAPSLAAEVRDVVEFHEGALDEADLRVEVHGDAEAEVDARLLRRALSNLIGNATRHAEPGTVIDVHVRRAADPAAEVTVTVCNVGDTVAPEHLDRLFDRFYRVERTPPADPTESSRHGLGLSIVDAVARMHGGRATASSVDGLTAVGIVLPTSGPVRGSPGPDRCRETVPDPGSHARRGAVPATCRP